MSDFTIPAPFGTECGSYACRRRIGVDTNIVRFDGRIFHRRCFVEWFPIRRRSIPDMTPHRIAERKHVQQT